ncbi:seryl-tRNA synthetase [Tistlia consotensis]|uniref:Serine--tRNA ligase n=1 Tax=Tistlia consotensis USBA 355 TaxID=560819 RepID=A0A1Y6BPL4_9PROT|nr:serine--tRNA ligase [Tistlia consotensis]SMF14151.1 seryl-tRNA synthetase [Tistlia consotensis USBA 355]SNR49817.1 seryl-tRNA synthetase [Tistlia consotensis]
MHDLKWIREQPEAFDRALARRGLAGASSALLALDRQNRQAQTELQELQARRNEASREIGQLKKDGGDAESLMAEVQAIKERMAALETETGRLDETLKQQLAGFPNILADDVPDGPDETANVELRAWGEKPAFGFQPKEHWELGEALGLFDFEAAARLSGSRFVVMKGGIARLHRALGQFMIDLHTRENGYLEVAPPLLVRDHVLFGTGQLPKFAEDQFRTTDDFWLIPTAEVPLTNLAAGQIFKAEELPLRVTALTPCFRSEAGSAGRDTRGMLRQHQFEKVELVSIVHPDESEAEQQRMTGCAEAVLQKLGLPYRVMVLSSGDTGFGARRTFDIEVWLPGQGAYREISSCSTCGDFQARRMGGRFRPEGEKGTRFLHTLNGSGVAVGRALIAVMENYQQADGTIVVPEALRPYLAGQEIIGG